MRRRLFALLAIAGLLSVSSCGGGGGGSSAPAPPPAPSITSFTAALGTVQAGTATTLTGVFSNGSGSINNGVGSVQSGVAITTGQLQATTSFTLTVTGSGGTTTSSTTVAVVPNPTITSFTVGSNPVPYNGSTTLTAVFSNGTGTVDQGVGTVQSGVSFNIGPLTASTTYTLTVANQYTNTTSQAVVTVLPPPPLVYSINPSAAAVGSRVELTGINLGGNKCPIRWDQCDLYRRQFLSNRHFGSKWCFQWDSDGD